MPSPRSRIESYSIIVMQASQQLNTRDEGGGTRDETREPNRPSSFFCRASSQQRIIAAVICLAIVAFFGIFVLAGRYNLDMGRWLGYCGFKQRTGLPCPTCGMTTATLAFAQGKIRQAFYIQPACGLLCSLAAVAGILAFVVAIFGVYFHFIGRFFEQIKLRYVILALLVVTAAGWAVTLARAIVERNG